jgi:hypothetical protein
MYLTILFCISVPVPYCSVLVAVWTYKNKTLSAFPKTYWGRGGGGSSAQTRHLVPTRALDHLTLQFPELFKANTPLLYVMCIASVMLVFLRLVCTRRLSLFLSCRLYRVYAQVHSLSNYSLLTCVLYFQNEGVQKM